jgi:hypothetical protein
MDIGELLGAALVVGFVAWLANLECLASLRALELKAAAALEVGRPQRRLTVEYQTEQCPGGGAPDAI